MKRVTIATGVTIAVLVGTALTTALLSEPKEIPCNILNVIDENTIECEWRQNKKFTVTCGSIEALNEERDEFLCRNGITKKIYHQMDRHFEETEWTKLQIPDLDYYRRK